MLQKHTCRLETGIDVLPWPDGHRTGRKLNGACNPWHNHPQNLTR